MSSGLIVLIFIVALILIVGYVVAVILRKRNEALLAALEERKEKLYNLPVNDEVEAVKNMHLIGQSQIAFREWNQKMGRFILKFILLILKTICSKRKAIIILSVS